MVGLVESGITTTDSSTTGEFQTTQDGVSTKNHAHYNAVEGKEELGSVILPFDHIKQLLTDYTNRW